jgi:hypothetical protein
MTDVPVRKVESADLQADFGPDAVAADEKRDERELKQVAENEVRADDGCVLEGGSIVHENVFNYESVLVGDGS